MAAASVESCPDEDVLAAFVERTLSGDDRAAVEAHVDECASCRETIAHVASTGDGETRRLGRYRLDRILGSGGMGVVWQAWDPALERGLAIKLLRPDITDDHGRARLVREARALAQLQHPNVIAIHDVGEIDGELFIATELIDGESLDRWQRGRAAAEVIAAYAQAARGLFAAHGLGLVHRDVKPSNILVGRDGRVRVGDFGLATRDRSEVTTSRGLRTEPSASSHAEPPLTSDGEVVGTPAYMAPEQRGGRTVDARADQYSLCVAIAEAVLGRRPLPGTTAAALAAQAARLEGGFAAPWAAIARGLAERPADRYPSLEPLIAALTGEPVRPRRGLAIAGVAVAIAAGGTALALRGGDPDAAATCALRRPLAGTWEAATRTAITDGFAARRLPYGADAARNTIAALDARAAELEAEDRRACEDAAAHRQPAEVVAKRQACLARVRDQLTALVDGLTNKPDAGIVQRAAASARALPDPATCNTAVGLADQTIPADAVTEARMSALSARVTRAGALRRLGKLSAARTTVEGALAEARATGFLPAIAEALHELGTILHAQGDPRAEQALVDGLAVAAEARADHRAARISALLVEIVGAHGDVAAAERQARLARTAIIRAGNDRRLEAVIERGLGRANQEAHTYAAAYDHYRRSEDIHAALGEREAVDFDRRAQVFALGMLDRLDDALRINQQVLASDRTNLGPKHPRTISNLTSNGLLLIRAGRYAEAAMTLEHALAIDEEVSGRDSVHAASIRARLAYAYREAGRIDEAEGLLRAAIAVYAKQLPATDRELLGQRANLAGAWIQNGRYAEAEAALAPLIEAARAAKDDELLAAMLQTQAEGMTRSGKHERALAAAREALERGAKVYGPMSRDAGEAHATLGAAYAGLGKPVEAAAEYQLALEAFERAIGKASPALGEPLTGLGELALGRGDAAAARPLFERAVAVQAAADPVELARSRFALARAHEALRDRAAAVAEARAALERVRDAGERAKALRADLERWLAAHR